ncbi:PREDICTED: probable serine/threonine-protein kinase At1g54610 [Camelina sativa]|uniref:Probable serine/threonine-protein kinase At1g54610 n=1 Tax=Camelina sativa TaxID=90675 RepID=A0ABM0THP2_CAMSA|nr:PREDICTED: probable serine/threonine-protein kinase At1g54610 [Camelina sativa]
MWLIAAYGDSIKDLTPRRATSYEKLDKIGQGTYNNVYKVVALKKVRVEMELKISLSYVMLQMIQDAYIFWISVDETVFLYSILLYLLF